MPKTKEQKREEAEARAAAHAKRTPEQQLALVVERPGGSEREKEALRYQVALADYDRRKAAKKGTRV